MQCGDGLHAHVDVLYLDECHDHPNLPHLCFYDHLTRHSKKENKIYILRHPPPISIDIKGMREEKGNLG